MIGFVLGGAAIAYCCASAICLRYPHLLHAPKPSRVNFLGKHSAHRGGAGERHENTMSAFRNAVRLKTDLLEMDVHMTADKEVVVIHDEGLGRLTGQAFHVGMLKYDEIEPLKEHLEMPVPFHPPGSYVENPDLKDCKDEAEKKKLLKPPLLRDVFKEFPDTPMNIDLKEDNPELIEKVHSLIDEFKRKDKTIWGSAVTVQAERIYKRDPTIPTFYSGKEVLKIYLKYYLGWLPFSKLSHDCFEIPMFSEAFEDNLKAFLESRSKQSRTRRFVTATVFKMIRYLSTRKLLFSHLDKRGVKVIVWVLNTEEDFEAAFGAGAHTVMTDNPTILRQYIDKKFGNDKKQS